MARGETYQAAAAALDEDTREYLSEDEGEDFSFPEFTEDWGNVIVVDNLPQIPPPSTTNCSVSEGIFAQTGTINTIEMPAENETTLGVAFVEFETSEEAQKAIRLTDGYVTSPTSSRSIASRRRRDWAPCKNNTHLRPSPNLYPDSIPQVGWETPCTDQSAIRYNNETEIKWCERSGPPTLEYGGERGKGGWIILVRAVRQVVAPR